MMYTISGPWKCTYLAFSLEVREFKPGFTGAVQKSVFSKAISTIFSSPIPEYGWISLQQTQSNGPNSENRKKGNKSSDDLRMVETHLSSNFHVVALHTGSGKSRVKISYLR